MELYFLDGSLVRNSEALHRGVRLGLKWETSARGHKDGA